MATPIRCEAARLARLTAIEEALPARERQIIIVSAADPVHYLECGGGPLAVPANPAEVLRWRRVMSHFETRTLDVPGDLRI